jgi:SHS2 domain-containing protein
MSLTYQEYRESYAGQLEIRGERRAAARALFKVLGARGVEVSESVRERIEGCTDPELLDQWLGRAITASRVEEIFD